MPRNKTNCFCPHSYGSSSTLTLCRTRVHEGTHDFLDRNIIQLSSCTPQPHFGPIIPNRIFALLIEYYAKIDDLGEQHGRCVAHDGPQLERDGQERNELDKGNQV